MCVYISPPFSLYICCCVFLYVPIFGNDTKQTNVVQLQEFKIPDANMLPDSETNGKLDFLSFSHPTYDHTNYTMKTTENFDRSTGIEIMFEAADIDHDGKLTKSEACRMLHAIV